MRLGLITLSNEGARVLSRLAAGFPDASLFVHDCVSDFSEAAHFSSIIDLTSEIFREFDGLVYVAPCGVVVRAVAPVLQDKHSDPAVVVVDVGARHAVSLLSGHEGGANDLTIAVSNLLGAEPVISTTSEAAKSVIVGLGCRRNTPKAAIVEAVKLALERAQVDLSEVRLIASADVKSDEQGLIAAAEELGLPLRFIASEEIRSSTRAFECSEFVQEKVNLPAVAEPAALLAGRRTRLILPKTKFNGITVAIGKESFMS